MTLPRFIKPMLAQAVPRPFDSDRYRFEVKWDGIRCLAFIEEGRIRLQSRQLLDMTGQFPELAALGALPAGTVLDGELIIFADNRPCLSAIQGRAQLHNRQRIRLLSQKRPVTFMVFDLLYARGQCLMPDPLAERRIALQETLSGVHTSQVVITDGVPREGLRYFEGIQKMGLEGMVAKDIASPYLPGKRSASWIKIKTTHPLRHGPQPAKRERRPNPGKR